MGQIFEDMNKALNQAIDYEKDEAKNYKIAFIRQGTNYVEIFGKVKTTLKELERAKIGLGIILLLLMSRLWTSSRQKVS